VAVKADVIIVGSGVIGLSLAWELRRRERAVVMVEKGEPGREASHAAGGMLAWCDDQLPAPLVPLAALSARIYPEFVREVEDASGVSVDLRSYGTIVLDHGEPQVMLEACRRLTGRQLAELEAKMQPVSQNIQFWAEASVDPRGLVDALVKAVRHRGAHIAHGAQAVALEVEAGCVQGVKTAKTLFSAPIVVNCAGAWAGQLSTPLDPTPSPTRPVKGQMLALVPRSSTGADPSVAGARSGQAQKRASTLVRHVVRTPEVYIIPRSDGRIVIGATVEEAGFDKRTDSATIQKLHRSAAAVVPALEHARIHETWAGLRPGSPDNLPILGATSLPGYFVATGHYRDGIMLAPATACLVAKTICGEPLEHDLSRFSCSRFATWGGFPVCRAI
jgi:glycine oxidase